MRKTTFSALLCSLLAAPAITLAASPMNPGLWEVTMTSDAMKRAPKISPEQAAQIRKMGIEVPEMKGGEMVTKVCYTKTMLSRDDAPGQEGQMSRECKTKNVTRNGERFSAEMECNGSYMKGTSTSNGTMSSTHFQFNSTFNGTVAGRPVNSKSQVSGTFVSENCGKVKPIGE